MFDKLKEAFNSKSRGQGVMAVVMATILGIVGVIMILVISNVLLGQLDTINASSLGNNSNATAAIGEGFALLSTTLGIVVLVVVVTLLGLALASFLGVFGGGAFTGGAGGGRRGRR